MTTTLVVMAAGLGSRYGGDKQTDGLGPHGETLMEYSIFDAIRAGFHKVVLILKPGMDRAMDALIGNRLRAYRLPDGGRVELAYVYQDFASLPDFFHVPEGRVKPYGTGHALLCAAEAVREPFCVLNADDYYGPDAFAAARPALCALPDAGGALMVGYVLKNTLSEGGTVSRGICEVRPDHTLSRVTECLKIGADTDGSLKDFATGTALSPDELVSMNLWGFAPSFFGQLRRNFLEFLRNPAGDGLKSECQLPTVVNAEMEAGRLTVTVLRSRGAWFGVTYREDRARVVEQLRRLHAEGVYPERLWEC